MFESNVFGRDLTIFLIYLFFLYLLNKFMKNNQVKQPDLRLKQCLTNRRPDILRMYTFPKCPTTKILPSKKQTSIRKSICISFCSSFNRF